MHCGFLWREGVECHEVCVEIKGQSLWESIFSFHQVGPRNRTQEVRLGSEHLCLPSHLAGAEIVRT